MAVHLFAREAHKGCKTRAKPSSRQETEHDEAKNAESGPVAGLLAAGATGALAGPAGAPGQSGGPGQWSMAGQNIDDTHFQAAEHEISPANAARLAPRWAAARAARLLRPCTAAQ